VLFADTVTYENESGAQITFNTVGHGKGFYFTGGTYSEITYAATDKGMHLYDSNGEILTVNRGKTYIGYMKSSALEGFKESLTINIERRQQTN
jgi:hypothetical protein